MKFKLFISLIKFQIIKIFAYAYVNSKYKSFWGYKAMLNKNGCECPTPIYNAYLYQFNASIGLRSQIKGEPITPHGLNGIHISEKACIGKNCIIFQQVTIGSNSIKGHKRYGAPSIGDNVLIGAGAKIIGKVKIGDNCRIGANCVVVADMPDNYTAVSSPTRFIYNGKNDPLNSFAGILE